MGAGAPAHTPQTRKTTRPVAGRSLEKVVERKAQHPVTSAGWGETGMTVETEGMPERAWVELGPGSSNPASWVCEDSEPCFRRRPGTPATPSPSTGQDLIGHGPWHPTPARASPVDQTSG